MDNDEVFIQLRTTNIIQRTKHQLLYSVSIQVKEFQLNTNKTFQQLEQSLA